MCKNKTETCKCCGHTATLVITDFDLTLPEERGRFIAELLKDTPHAGLVSLQMTAHCIFGEEDLNMEEHADFCVEVVYPVLIVIVIGTAIVLLVKPVFIYIAQA